MIPTNSNFRGLSNTTIPGSKMTLKLRSLVMISTVAIFLLGSFQPVRASETFATTDSADVNAAAWQKIGIYDAYKTLGLSPETAGAGVRVAVIDSGIGVFPKDNIFGLNTLDCFQSPVAAVTNFAGQERYTNSRVQVARAGGRTINDRGGKSTAPADAMAIGPHGSHVAGIIGCNQKAQVSIDGTKFGTMTGIAPGVTFGSYNVFPDNASVTTNDIGDMITAAVDDGSKVINMSLGIAMDGDPFGFGHDDGRLEKALAYAEEHNVLVVAASGNDGPDAVIRPANTATVLSVGAVSGGVNAIHELLLNSKSFTALGGPVGWSNTVVTGNLFPTSGKLQDGCSPLPKTYRDKIAVLKRGSCYFDSKFIEAKTAGAIGVLLVDVENSPADLHMSSGKGIKYTLPGGLISPTVWSQIQAELVGKPNLQLSISPTTLVKVPVGVMMSFSSYSRSGEYRPDLVAPGGGIFSSITGAYNANNSPCGSCYMIADGTSMAAPVVTGVAALLYQLHPTWSVQMIRSALIHTASTSYVKATGGGTDPGPRFRGTGVIDALAVINASIGFSTSSTKFQDSKTTLTILNPTNKDISVKITNTGIALSTRTSALIPANSSFQLQVTSTGKGLGTITVTPDSGSTITQNLFSEDSLPED